MSGDTAKLLTDSGKGHWISPRKDMVEAKGKGKLQTYWLMTRERSAVQGRKGNANDIEINQSKIYFRHRGGSRGTVSFIRVKVT